VASSTFPAVVIALCAGAPAGELVLADLRNREGTSPDALVSPNTEGCPYVRLQSAGKGSGTSAWRVLKEAMGHSVR